MVYRVAATLIVIFWLTMTALLLRKELAPGSLALQEVPVSHVMKLMFLHGQASDLNIHDERQLVGQLRLHPQVRKGDGMRLLDFGGGLFFSLPGQSRQRVSWGGEFVLNRALAVQLVRLNLNFRDASETVVEVLIEPQTERLRYRVRSNDRQVDQGDYSLDERGILQWLEDRGLETTFLQQIRKPNSPHPSIKAWQSSIEIHGQRLETYRVTIEHGGQTFLEFHVNQLGQILEAKSFLGYTAAPEDSLP